jgi:hypothetical protein
MNLFEMNESLPNSLHDADIELFSFDLKSAIIRFTVDLWVGTMADPPEIRERYRRGTLSFTGVQGFSKSENENFDDTSMTLLTWNLEEDLAQKAKFECKANKRFFCLNACYCEFIIACDDVSFEWLDAHETNRGE